MANSTTGPFLRINRARRLRDVAEGGQRILHGRHMQAFCLEQGNDLSSSIVEKAP